MRTFIAIILGTLFVGTYIWAAMNYPLITLGVLIANLAACIYSVWTAKEHEEFEEEEEDFPWQP